MGLASGAQEWQQLSSNFPGPWFWAPPLARQAPWTFSGVEPTEHEGWYLWLGSGGETSSLPARLHTLYNVILVSVYA